MADNKSIDGLSPRRPQKNIASANADGFTPVAKPRKTKRKTKDRVTTAPSSPERPSRSTTAPAAESIRPEDFVPSRKAVPAKRKLPQITNTAEPTASPATTEKSTAEINEDFLEPLKALDFDEETGELVDTKEPEPSKNTKPSQRKRKPKRSKKRKIILWTLAIVFLLLAAGVAWFVLWGNNLLASFTSGQGNLMDLITETYSPLQEDQHQRTNVLLFGTSGFDMAGTEFEGVVHDGASLTDSIMVVSFDQTTGNTALISLPRDLYIDAGCNYTGKINEIYYCNNLDGVDETAGAEALVQAVSQILDLDLPYYVHLNWGSLQQIVDALGGITITLDEPVYDYGYTNAVYDAGVPYTISGADAIGLARARHGTENGDFSRSAFQQKILLGIKDKVISSNLSISNLLDLANALNDNLRTNFSVGELKTLAHLATTVDWSNITEVSFLEPEPLLTDGIIGEISYVYPAAGISDYSEIQAYVDGILTNQPAPTATSSIPDEAATILVLNSTGTAGLASTEQAALEAAGFANITIDNFPSALSTPYTLYTFADKPATQQALEQRYGIAATVIDATSVPPADIPLGYDFVLILGAQ